MVLANLVACRGELVSTGNRSASVAALLRLAEAANVFIATGRYYVEFS